MVALFVTVPDLPVVGPREVELVTGPEVYHRVVRREPHRHLRHFGSAN